MCSIVGSLYMLFWKANRIDGWHPPNLSKREIGIIRLSNKSHGESRNLIGGSMKSCIVHLLLLISVFYSGTAYADERIYTNDDLKQERTSTSVNQSNNRTEGVFKGLVSIIDSPATRGTDFDEKVQRWKEHCRRTGCTVQVIRAH